MPRSKVDRVLDLFVQLTPAEVDQFAQRLTFRDAELATTLEEALKEITIC